MTRTPDTVRCIKCPKTVKTDKWSKIRAWSDGWFFSSKTGDVFCPEHIPEWVTKWRAKQAAIRPRIKLHTDGDRIAIDMEGIRPENFDEYNQKVKDQPDVSFDWDEKTWSVPLTLPAIAGLQEAFGDEIEMSVLLGAWVADRQVIQRIEALESGVIALSSDLKALMSEFGKLKQDVDALLSAGLADCEKEQQES